MRSVRTGSRRPLVLSTALFVSHQFGELMVPVVAGVVIDRAVVTSDGAALVRWLAVLTVVFAGLSLSWRFADRILVRSQEQAAHGLRLRLVARVTDHQGMAAAPPAGQMVSVASSDATAVAEIQTAVAMLVSGVAAILTATVVLLSTSVPLGLVVILGLPPVLGALHLLGAPIEKRVAAQQADVAHAAATATDLLAGLRVLKGLRAEAEASARYRPPAAGRSPPACGPSACMPARTPADGRRHRRRSSPWWRWSAGAWQPTGASPSASWWPPWASPSSWSAPSGRARLGGRRASRGPGVGRSAGRRCSTSRWPPPTAPRRRRRAPRR